MFRNRKEAGQILGEHLMGYATQSPVVYGLARGGVVVGYEIARQLEAPLDVIVVRKLGAPQEPELALGAVADGIHREVVLNRRVIRHCHLPLHYIRHEVSYQTDEIHRRETELRGHRAAVSARGKTAILVDDGIATGATMRAALRRVRWEKPHQVILAVPVAAEDALEELMHEVNHSVCLEIPSDLSAISQAYWEFTQVEDEEVRRLLEHAAFRSRVAHE